MLGVYNLTSGERIAMVDLAAVAGAGDDAVHFANDVAVADDGTAYVTDTRALILYEVDTDYAASVLHRFEDGGAGPNGIVHHPGGYLLVARGAGLWKVPLDDPRPPRRSPSRRRSPARTAWCGRRAGWPSSATPGTGSWR